MRKRRQLKKGAKYEVWSTINRNEAIFEVELIKVLLLFYIRKAKRKYTFKLYSYNILDNTIYLILKPTEKTDLPEIMQWILCNFAKKYNKLNGYSGHLWKERYKSEIIIDDHLFNAYMNIAKKGQKIMSEWQENYGSAIMKIYKGYFCLLDPPSITVLQRIQKQKCFFNIVKH